MAENDGRRTDGAPPREIHIEKKGTNWLAWLLLALGVAFAATQWLIIAAYEFGSATELSPFNYSVVVFSGLLSWGIFGTVPAISAAIGTVLIIAGGVASIEGGHKEGLGHPIGVGHWAKRWAWHWHELRHTAGETHPNKA